MSRFSSPPYRICFVVVWGYAIMVVLSIVGRNSFIRADGVCIIGLKNFSTIPLIAYDLFLNVFLTTMFLWPLWRSDLRSHRLRNVATRTLRGACVSLMTSAANIAILTAMKGDEFGWMCLASCVIDVTLNAIVFSWVTSRPDSNNGITFDRFSLPTLDVGPLMLVQPDPSQERKPEQCGENASQPYLRPLPASFYDYIPRDQLSRTSTHSTEDGHRRSCINKFWFWNLSKAPRRTQEPLGGAQRATGATECVMQSSSVSIMVTHPDLNTDSTVEGKRPSFEVVMELEKDICEC